MPWRPLVVSMGKRALGPPTVDDDGEQTIEEGLQPLVPAGDDLVENLCGEAEEQPWGPCRLQTQPRGRYTTPPGPGGSSLTTMSRSAWVPVKTGMSMGTRTE